MMMVVTMLIYAFSLYFQFPPRMIIHNRCSSIKLVSPVYFDDGAVCTKLSNQLTEIGTLMNASFEIKTAQDEFEGALLFKLQRYFDRQYNMNTSTTEADNNETKYVHMLVAWKVKDSCSFAHVVLVEHTKKIIWNGDQLKKLYDKSFSWLKEYNDTISDTWSMNSNMVLKTSFKVRWLRYDLLSIIGLRSARDSKENFELNISISEERDDYAIRPFRVNLEG
jgi:hypothetical protein